MSAIALSAPRVFRLPRVKFKRPRWPKGSRVSLVYCVVNIAFAIFELAQVAIGTGDGVTAFLAGFNAFVGVWNGAIWWRSRDDDDGPSAT